MGGPVPGAGLRVVRGNPDREELAVLVALLTALPSRASAPTAATVRPGRAAWDRATRTASDPSPASWRGGPRDALSP